MTEFLDLEGLLLSHPLGHNQVVDLGLLAAMAERPRAWLYRVDAYPSVEGKAAVLLESLLRARGSPAATRRWFGWQWWSSWD